MGSTSWAMMTSLASLFSTRLVTWLRPCLRKCGFLCCGSLPASLACAISINRSFLGRALRLVLGQETEQLGGLVAVDSHVELVERRRDLKTGHKDPLLALQSHASRPLDVTSQIAL